MKGPSSRLLAYGVLTQTIDRVCTADYSSGSEATLVPNEDMTCLCITADRASVETSIYNSQPPTGDKNDCPLSHLLSAGPQISDCLTLQQASGKIDGMESAYSQITIAGPFLGAQDQQICCTNGKKLDLNTELDANSNYGSEFYDSHNFAGTPDQAVCLQGLSDRSRDDDDDAEMYIDRDYWTPCTGSYSTLQQLDDNRDPIPDHCVEQYLVGVQLAILEAALEKYKELIDTGYDEKFERYAKKGGKDCKDCKDVNEKLNVHNPKNIIENSYSTAMAMRDQLRAIHIMGNWYQGGNSEFVRFHRHVQKSFCDMEEETRLSDLVDAISLPYSIQEAVENMEEIVKRADDNEKKWDEETILTIVTKSLRIINIISEKAEDIGLTPIRPSIRFIGAIGCVALDIYKTIKDPKIAST